MDTLSFSAKTIKSEFTGDDIHLAEIIINGSPLAKIIEPLERNAAEKNGKKYIGFGYDYQFASELFLELLAKSSAASKNEVALMICDGCYEEGCWPLLVTVSETETEVTWSKFHNHHRSKQALGKTFWDYSDFPVFHFAKETYYTALSSLLKLTGGTNRFSAKHRKQLEKDTVCGCFYCGKIFSPMEIVEWCAETADGEGVTAICPYCGIDSIVGEHTRLPITPEILQFLHAYSF